MNTSAITLYDILRRNMPDIEAREAVSAIEELAGDRSERVVDLHTKRAVATELKHVPTREDLQVLRAELREDIHKRTQAMLYWIMGGIVAVLASIVGGIFGILEKLP